MAKKSISNTDLNWMVVEQMKEDADGPRGFTVAIVSEGRTGWRAVVETRTQKNLTEQSKRRLKGIQRKLRATCALTED